MHVFLPHIVVDCRCFDMLILQLLGPRMMYRTITNHEVYLRRKLKGQQQAIEMEGRRFMGLQPLDLRSRDHHLGSPMPLGQAQGQLLDPDKFLSLALVRCLQVVTLNPWFLVVDNNLNSTRFAMSAPAAAAISAADAEGKHEEQQEEDGDAGRKQMVNLGEVEKRESGPVTATQNVAFGFQER